MNDIMYANSVEMQMQLFDIKLKFNFNNGSEEAKSSTILLSPQHAKVLKNMLVDIIANYEAQFGEIGIPSAETIKEGETS